MRRVHLLLTAIALAAPAMASTSREARDAAAQARLAKIVDGLVPGKPVSCVSLRDVPSSQLVDGLAIVYRAGSRRLYVNRPAGGCEALRENRAIATRTPSDRLCSGDIVRIFDAPSGIDYGSCALGEFVPYERPARP